MMTQKKVLMLVGLMGMLAVILGAFGAHALKKKLSADQLVTYQTGIDYHYYHVLALLGVAVLMSKAASVVWLQYSAWSFLIGILCFSGSIYLLACKDLLGLGGFTKILGPITPIGGLFLIAGWAFLFLHAMKSLD